MAIDPGAKRIGIAISDPEGTVAVPLEVIPNDATAMDRIRGAAERINAEVVVVGLPVRLDGKEGAEAESARAFASAVFESLGIPVHMLDERLSSKQVSRAMSRGGINSRRQRGKLDGVAAAMLLQSYLDSRKKQ
ncbi:MAG TPA: Holliday junction resolvase RuvX [Actinomycetota bacterium]|nr:Holliday junction resolvase RuvX [Actinomycetota bacterium]